MPTGGNSEETGMEWLKPVSQWIEQQQSIDAVQFDDVAVASQEAAEAQTAAQTQAESQAHAEAEAETKARAEAEADARHMAMMAAMSQSGGMDILSEAITFLNGNPYFIGTLMLVLNLGGRFISSELTQKQEEFLQQRWLRPFIFFTVLFVATRNIAVAFWMTLGLFLVLWVIGNENSPFCLIPGWRKFDQPVEEKVDNYEANLELIAAIRASQMQQQQGQQQMQR